MIVAAWAAGVLGSLLPVQGWGDCPSPEQVSSALSGLLSPGGERDTDTATVVPDGGDLVITIAGPDGSVPLTRRIARSPGSRRDCAALAAAAAVVIATWKIERNAELSLLQPGVSFPPAPTMPAALPVEAVGHAYRAPPARTPLPASFTVGAGVGTSAAATGFTDLAQIDLAARPRGWPAGLSVSVAVDGQRDQPLGGGTATWRRMTAGLGAWMALSESTVGIEASARLFAGRTSVAGSGFGVNRSDEKISPGLDLTLTLAGTGAVQPFFQATGRGWFAPQDVAVLQSGQMDASAPLPRIEARFGVGLRFQLAR